MNGDHIRYIHAVEKDGIRIFDRVCYLVENAGQVAKLASYMDRFPSESKAHKADLQLAIGDVFVQAAMLCLDLGLSPQEVYDLGRKHCLERYADFEARGWGKTVEPAKLEMEPNEISRRDKVILLREIVASLQARTKGNIAYRKEVYEQMSLYGIEFRETEELLKKGLAYGSYSYSFDDGYKILGGAGGESEIFKGLKG